MANERDWDVLELKINKAQKENDDFKNNGSKEKNRSKAFTAVAISAILDIDMDSAIDAITDAGSDLGVDAVYIDTDGCNDVHLFQMKCKTDFKDASCCTFPSDTITKISTYLTILGGMEPELLKSANKLIKQKTVDARQVIKEPKGRVIIHFVGNMNKLQPNQSVQASAIFKKHNVKDFKEYDLESLVDCFFRKDVKQLDKKIQLVGNYLDHEDEDNDIKGLVCTVKATEIVKMITSENDPESVDYDIFDKNVRVYLKHRNKINKNIIASAIAEDNHMFWYQNNGITMTCDKIIDGFKMDSQNIELKNVQIVNGGQTSNSLFKAAKTNPEKIEKVSLLVRIIETDDEDIKFSIAKSTNSQTPIISRDLKANDPQQKDIQKFFMKHHYFYECKAKEFEDEDKSERIDALSAGQAYLAYGLERPEVAKANRGRVFGNLYDEIFTEDLDPMHLLISIQLSDLFLERKVVLRTKIKNDEPLIDGEESLMDGAFHALFALRKVLEKKGLDVWSYEEGKKCIDEAVGVIYEIYKDAKQTETNFSSNRFFKDMNTKKLIAEKIEKL